MLTPFGQAVRILRIDKGLRLKEMADALGVTSAFLSAVETGRKNVSEGLVDKIAIFLNLSDKEKQNLFERVEESKTEARIQLGGLSSEYRQTAVAFARRFSGLSEQDIEKLKEILATKK